ncbi:MAG: PKD domain-containing protein [Flavobacteriia bacterium]|nr:PKD domain-containing protein [Flavobacteriia bacterium]
MIKFITSFVFVSLSLMAFSQSVVVSNTQTPTQLINNVLLGMGVTASNITINGNPVTANAAQGNVASFTNTNPAFPISSGLLLTTGNSIAAQGPNNSTNLSNNLPATASVASDPHLNILAAGTVTNGVVLEFDFIPTGDTLNFRYLFGSEEYPEFSPSTFNDAFGLFLWGPGITGPYALAGYANGANIATIPGGIPVTINNVGDASNTQYYVFNDNGSTYGNAIQYDGTTVLLTAAASVQCNQTYHIKLAISNVSDQAYDSGVFLEANSFSSNVVDVAVATVSGDTTIIEGCNFADIVFTRPEGNMLDTLSIIYTIGGTATEGADYANLMDTIIFLPGVDTVIVNLSPLQDNIIEGYESVIISVNIINPCGDTIVSSGTIYVWDGPIIDSLWSTNANCLPTGSVHVDIVAPSVPATYLWTSPNALTFSGPDWQNINPGWYYITVTQAQCSVSDSVEVLLTAPPLANFSIVAPLSNCQPAEFSFVNNSLNATSYNWTFGDGNGSAGNNPSHTYLNQTFGTYTVQLIAFVDPLCTSDTTLTINLDVCACIDPTALNFNVLANVDDGSCIYPFPEVFAPNVFTPNSDAENPTYFLSGKNLVSLELTILNRWGAVVFSKSSSDLINNNPAWDGKINGDLATDGIYFYIYKATGITNQVVEGHGFLHLISDK